ncbi:hypothetical protein [Moraxella bovis]|uniref:hypothetical protein n=1 Tax=Moraxella bovis TaxID=476 RepID=UPI000994190F|nr:hypothetical protein [Moraxella bovis]AWY20875.1 hypothetical protein DQF64_10515 [Moraxella bovis]OOR90970.1 hypothetical protein B0182_04085 [Moraxella bovis]
MAKHTTHPNDRIGVSKHDMECHADEFVMAEQNFYLLSEAVELLKQHKDDVTGFATLCQLIQQACYNMANNTKDSSNTLLATTEHRP